MPRLEKVLLVELVPYRVKLFDQLVLVAAQLLVLAPAGEACGLQRLDDEYGMMCGQGASALGDDVGLWQVVLAAGVDYGVYHLFESWHDALQCREEALDLFSIGIVDLRNRALAEKLFWEIAREVANTASSMKHPPEELRKVARMLPDKYYCNFSLFQSLPDSWAIDQVFPIVPISRLDEKPTRMATLQDMTCDSDGKIATFISPQGITKALPVHPLKPGEPYYLGVFLVGAYQEILGDMHNLFGDTNAVHITCYKDHYEIDKVIDGETVAEVLDYVQYDPKRLVRNVETWVTKAMKADKITPEEGREFLSNYRSGLYGYTYLEND